MALFNNINRRIKSMQEGGQPFGGNVVMPDVDDGSIGGFNRPELRGLRKQARRGTLTNRERRRLNYLTNEAKGRRRRGLLSGLGGAAAALGTAALIKSGGAKGLMDSIKGKMSDLKAGLKEGQANRASKRMDKILEEERRQQFGIGEEKVEQPINIDDIEVDEIDIEEPEEVIEGEKSGEELAKEAAAMRQLMAEEQDLEESDRLTDEEQLQDATREADKISAIEEAKSSGTYKRVTPPRVDRGSTPEEQFAPGTSTEDMLEALQNVETPEERQRILDMMGAVKGGGDGPTLEEVQRDLLEKGRGPSGGPLKGGVPSGQGEEVEAPMSTEDMLDQLQQGVDPEVLGAVRGGGEDSLLSKVDPEGLVQGEEGAEGALSLLQSINRRRADFGLPPATQLTKELIDSPTGKIERLNPRQAGPIQSSAGDPFGGTLPVLRAQQLLRENMPSGRMNVGGMVKRMMQRYK